MGRCKCGVKVRIFNRLLIFLHVRATSQPLAVAGLAAGYSGPLSRLAYAVGQARSRPTVVTVCGADLQFPSPSEFRVRKCHSKLRYVGLPKFTAASRGTPCDSVASCLSLNATVIIFPFNNNNNTLYECPLLHFSRLYKFHFCIPRLWLHARSIE